MSDDAHDDLIAEFKKMQTDSAVFVRKLMSRKAQPDGDSSQIIQMLLSIRGEFKETKEELRKLRIENATLREEIGKIRSGGNEDILKEIHTIKKEVSMIREIVDYFGVEIARAKAAVAAEKTQTKEGRIEECIIGTWEMISSSIHSHHYKFQKYTRNGDMIEVTGSNDDQTYFECFPIKISTSLDNNRLTNAYNELYIEDGKLYIISGEIRVYKRIRQ